MATPDALSLMPGPSGTESRWAPTTTTSSGFPVRVWASTLRLWVSSVVVTSVRVTGAPARPASASPAARDTPPVGTTPVADSPRVPSSSGPSSLLITIRPAAPAVAACAAFCANGQVPRRTSAIDPGVTAAASAGSQPSPTISVSGPVTPPSGVVGENPSAATSTGSPPTVSSCRCASNRRAVNVGVCTSYPAPRSVSTTWSTLAS
ncbi:hypothetical protein BJF90_31725 [Pseudonocardia sp. CNS-004]|nr:hypothetical protein BJF90_31725 [Pseudonocardia sp. CNS-004]